MKINITVGELIDRDLWVRAAELLDLDPYAVNEGRIDRDHELTISSLEACKIGLIGQFMEGFRKTYEAYVEEL